MTIFLEAMKRFIHENLDSLQQASSQADSSLFNAACGVVGHGRSQALAETKRDILERLGRVIDEYHFSEDDEQNFKELQALLSQSKAQIERDSETQGYRTGQTEAGLKKLKDDIETIYNKTKRLNLCDKTYQDNPLDIFRMYCVLCYAKKESFFRAGGRAPLNIAREQLLEDQLKYFEDASKALSENHAAYNQASYYLVQGCIQALLERNQSLGRNHSVVGITPGPGTLGARMLQAKVELDRTFNPCESQGLFSEKGRESNIANMV